MKHRLLPIFFFWLIAAISVYGQVTLNPSADTDTQSDGAAGTNPTLNISQWCNPLLRFDLSSITGTVSAARLRLYFPTGNAAFTVTAHTTSTDTWSEGGAKPGAGTTIISRSVPAASGATYVEIDLTAYVQSKVSGNKIASLRLLNNLDNWTTFNSRQASANRPELVVTSSTTTPITPGRVEAENWTTMLGVQTETTTDTGGGLNVGWINNGDWMDYSINFASAGSYTVSMRIAGNGGQCQIRDGVTVLSTVTIPATGGWQVWRTITTTINIPTAGQRTIRLVSTAASGWNINYFEYAPSGTPSTFTLTANANNGVVTRNPSKTAYTSGEVVTLTATPNSGFVFSNWTGDVTGTANPISVTMNGNKNITANFTAVTPTTYTLTTTATNGTITRSPNKTSYNSGETVTLTATPNSGFVFSNWSGDASGFVNPISITMTGNRNITANFTPVGTTTTLLDQNATQETRNLWDYLNQIYGQKVLTGIWEQSGLDDIRAHSGRTAAILGQDMNGWHARNSANWETAMTLQSTNLINHYNNGGIVFVNWHWANPFNTSVDAWSDITTTQWNNMLRPGTSEYNTLIADLDLHVNRYLKRLIDRNGRPIPIIFRPLHEIDGGWFWWTNESDPSKTVQLYKLVQDRIMNFHGLHNLIWVWNNSEIVTSASQSGAYYPGNSFADFVSIDLYNIDFRDTGVRKDSDGRTFRDYYNMLGQIAPGKMRALGEVPGLPNADKTQNNDPAFPRWLYSFAWYAPNDGTLPICHSSPCNPPAWVNTTYNHDIYLTLDEIATNGSSAAPASTRAASLDEVVMESKESSVKIFPNPATNGTFTISILGFHPNEKVSINIVPLNGEPMYDQTVTTNEQGERYLSISQQDKFKKGVYILKVKGQSKTIMSKIILH